jgi:hypothetical protein
VVVQTGLISQEACLPSLGATSSADLLVEPPVSHSGEGRLVGGSRPSLDALPNVRAHTIV